MRWMRYKSCYHNTHIDVMRNRITGRQLTACSPFRDDNKTLKNESNPMGFEPLLPKPVFQYRRIKTHPNRTGNASRLLNSSAKCHREFLRTQNAILHCLDSLVPTYNSTLFLCTTNLFIRTWGRRIRTQKTNICR